jgi:hypothetical protein
LDRIVYRRTAPYPTWPGASPRLARAITYLRGVAARAVLFAINEDDLVELERLSADSHVIEYVQEVIEERWEEGFVFELDKSWDALHRSLTDGKLEMGSGDYPANALVMGREWLYAADDYFVGLVRAADVPEVARAAADVTAEQVKAGYQRLGPEHPYSPEWGEEDLQYTLEYFEGLPDFWRRAAEAGRSVIFTVDQ